MARCLRCGAGNEWIEHAGSKTAARLGMFAVDMSLTTIGSAALAQPCAAYQQSHDNPSD